MRIASVWAPLLLAALALPGTLDAQRGRTAERSGWMGVRFEWRGDERNVAVVEDVVDDSPAGRAGIRRGEEVLGINGEAPTQAVVERLRETLHAGDTVRLRLRRDGRQREVRLVAAARPDEQVIVMRGGTVYGLPPGEGLRAFRGDTVVVRMDTLVFRMDSLRRQLWQLRPDSTARFHSDSLRLRLDTLIRRGGSGEGQVFRFRIPEGAQGRPETRAFERLLGEPFLVELGRRGLAGAELADMNEGLGRYFRVNEGVLVLRVSPATPAARAGLRPGDVIVVAGGDSVGNVEDLRRAFVGNRDGRLELRIVREGRRQTLQMEWNRATTYIPAERRIQRR